MSLGRAVTRKQSVSPASPVDPVTHGALDWLNDKVVGSPFALPALCLEKSFIPHCIWIACDVTTNVNEGRHADANRDGNNLTLTGVCYHRKKFDRKRLTQIANMEKTGVSRTYRAHDFEDRYSAGLRRTGEAECCS